MICNIDAIVSRASQRGWDDQQPELTKFIKWNTETCFNE